MNGSVYSSNNEEGLLKSFGPFRITTAGISFTGVQTPEVTKIAPPVLVTTLQIFGSQISVEPQPLHEQDPISES